MDSNPIVNDIETPGKAPSVDSTTSSTTKTDGNLSDEEVNTEKNSENTKNVDSPGAPANSTTTETTDTKETTSVDGNLSDENVEIGGKSGNITNVKNNIVNNQKAPNKFTTETEFKTTSTPGTTTNNAKDGNVKIGKKSENVKNEGSTDKKTLNKPTTVIKPQRTPSITNIKFDAKKGEVTIEQTTINITKENLDLLTEKLRSLTKKNVKFVKKTFSLTWERDNVNICGSKIKCNTVDDLKNILSLLTCLKNLGMFTETIKIKCEEDQVLFDNTVFKEDMVTNVEFWNVIKENSDLFNFEYDPLYIKKGLDSTYVFIYNDSNKNYKTIPGVALIQPDVFFENTTESTDKWILRTEWQKILNEDK